MKINEIINECHKNAVEHGFWDNEVTIISKLYTKQSLTAEEIIIVDMAFKTQKIMLIVTELAEAVEGLRRGDKRNVNEELADTVIRIADTCGGYNIDLETAIERKIEKNKNRPRLHGKKF